MTETSTAALNGAGTNAAPDYAKTMSIANSADAVFDALTTVSGLAGWWTSVTGVGLAGGALRFVFTGDEPCVMRVTTADRPTSVHWVCVGYRPLADWAGTTVRFDIRPVTDSSCELSFMHVGLTPKLECYQDCRNGWDHFLPSLREYAESGQGSPYGSDTDIHRRDARGQTASDANVGDTAAVSGA